MVVLSLALTWAFLGTLVGILAFKGRSWVDVLVSGLPLSLILVGIGWFSPKLSLAASIAIIATISLGTAVSVWKSRRRVGQDRAEE